MYDPRVRGSGEVLGARHGASTMSGQSLVDDVVDELVEVDDDEVSDDADESDEVDELGVLDVEEVGLLDDPPRLSFL